MARTVKEGLCIDCLEIKKLFCRKRCNYCYKKWLRAGDERPQQQVARAWEFIGSLPVQ